MQAAVCRSPSSTLHVNIQREVHTPSLLLVLHTCYNSLPPAGPGAVMEREAATWRHRLLMGTVFALPVAVLSMGGMLPGLESIMRGPLVVRALPLGWIVQALLAAVVQVGVLQPG